MSNEIYNKIIDFEESHSYDKYEMRDIPNDPDLIARAKGNPNGHVYELDWEYPDWAEVYLCSVIGAWKVDENGLLTGEYWVNEDYRPIQRSDRQPPENIKRLEGVADIWCRETDPEYKKKYQFPLYPEHTHIGDWYFDKEGQLTNLFRPNPYYIPPNKDNEK